MGPAGGLAPVLRAAELVHAGKGTSPGLGRVWLPTTGSRSSRMSTRKPDTRVRRRSFVSTASHPAAFADANAIEVAWSKVKTILRGHAARTWDALIDAVADALWKITALAGSWPRHGVGSGRKRRRCRELVFGLPRWPDRAAHRGQESADIVATEGHSRVAKHLLAVVPVHGPAARLGRRGQRLAIHD